MKKILPVIALTALVLTGCGTNNEDAASPSQSPSRSTSSSSASATSTSPSPSQSPSSESPASPETTATETPVQAINPPADQPVTTETPVSAIPEYDPSAAQQLTVEDFINTGGKCISDAWTSTLPFDAELFEKVKMYCDTNDLGDWAGGNDPYAYAQQYQQQTTRPEPQFGYTNNELTYEQCQILDHNTAMSGQIQYCGTEYGL
ncbi:hypothetical protein [Rothia terrae]|uniref:hypothetical protein n=2 Tax=Rothia terrae TaxID=396015 RepID=UPI0033D79607